METCPGTEEAGEEAQLTVGLSRRFPAYRPVGRFVNYIVTPV